MFTEIHQVGAFGLLLFLATIKLVKVFLKRSQTVHLRGPPRTSFLFGSGIAFGDSDTALNYIRWAKEYGHVYNVPLYLGINSLVICDLKAIAHVHAKDTFTYVLQPAIARFQDVLIGHNMSTSEGEEHKSLRKAMAPAFSTAVLRRITSVFYGSAYKIKTHWDTLFESDTEVVIDVQKWMNRLALDVVGIAGFGYDFKSLDGHPSLVLDAFEAFVEARQGVFSQLTFFAAAIMPSFIPFPTKNTRLFAKLNNEVTEIARQMIENEHSERKVSDTICNTRDTSILGLLVKGEFDATNKLSRKEMISHIKFFLSAGHETSASKSAPLTQKPNVERYTNAVTLTWALIELARHPVIQQKLREELQRFSNSDPTWDQLKSDLPLLDAIVYETLRLYPPLRELIKTATEDDVIPLSSPILNASGEMVDFVVVPKGTTVILPNVFFNQSEEFWGSDAQEFVPERWFREFTPSAKGIRGHRHIFTFSDGPKKCLGKDFAVAELKITLSVLIRSFTFELLDGPDTKLGLHLGILPRPKLAGESTAVMPMRVKQVMMF